MNPAGGDWKDMFAAAQKGDAPLVEYYLQQGIDPNYQHPEVLTTVLIEAATLGQAEVVKVLLAKGANPSLKSELDGWDALEIAKVHRHKEVISLLENALGIEPERPSFWQRLFLN
ncbi:MAG: ankyrin repeat domain-containing protein [Bacteroidia bacterium]